MKVKIESGTRCWFEVKLQGADSVTFERDLLVNVEPYRMFWYKTIGHVAGLPTEHPGILINEILPA